jgi:hydrogenase expression/formation protein HypD
VKFRNEYHDPAVARRLVDRLAATVTRPWTVMEVCGGRTHTLIRQGIDQLLPEALELVHGPGCPVCVMPLSVIDHAIEISRQHDVVLCSFGDMLRVPGSTDDLLRVRTRRSSPSARARISRGHVFDVAHRCSGHGGSAAQQGERTSVL